jgi:hypothetical protein
MRNGGGFMNSKNKKAADAARMVWQRCTMKRPDFAVVLVVVLVLAIALSARAQHLRLLSMWRHVSEDGLAISPCGDSGWCPHEIKIMCLISIMLEFVSNSVYYPRLSRHARFESKAIVL